MFPLLFSVLYKSLYNFCKTKILTVKRNKFGEKIMMFKGLFLVVILPNYQISTIKIN